MNPDEIQRGNEGIDIGEWTGWDGPKDFAPLPGEPAEDARVPRPVVPSALNDARVTLEWARSGRDRPPGGVR